MKLFLKYLSEYKKLLILTLVLATVNQVFSLLDPQIFRILIDNYGTQAGKWAQTEFVRGVVLLLLAYVGVAFVSRTAKAFQDYYTNVITQRLGTKLYANSVAHSFSLPFAVFEDQRSGEILQKLQKARLDVQKLIASMVNVVFLSLVSMIVVFAYAFSVHWSLGIMYALIIPTIGSAVYVLSKKIKTAQANIVREMSNLAGSTTETLRNVELVKSLGLEGQEVGRLNSVNEVILKLELQKVKYVRKLDFIQGTMLNALRACMIFLMFFLIFRGVITLGQYFTLLIYSFFIFNPLTSFGQVVTDYQEATASMEQLETVFKMPPEEKPKHPKKVPVITSLRFEGVTFSYPTVPAPALKDIFIEARAGETIAFVGPSGSGKTTVVKLLAGLYKPTAGKIWFAGVSADEIDFNEFRRRIGFVAQDTQLFAGTIRENLLFVKPDATDKECTAAMRAAAAGPILERGGQGLETKIGEGGLKLSGGEKQRLAIARALLREPDLIIFDEATSSLDSVTEKAITETIESIAGSRKDLITVLIAHRLSTVAHADRIYVLERGKLVETGTHKKLSTSRGLYAALWREQIAAEPES